MVAGDDMTSGRAPSVKFTYDDLVNFPNDGKRHEIIDGEHFVTPSPNTKHQTVVMNVTAAFNTYLKDHPVGALFVAPFDVVFSDLDVVEPDLLFIVRDRANILTDQHVRGAPDLVVEILSPGTRRADEITKRKLYERFGVAEYWVVDPELDIIKIYRRDPQCHDSFARAIELGTEGHDVLTTPLVPSFEAPLEQLFAPAFS